MRHPHFIMLLRILIIILLIFADAEIDLSNPGIFQQQCIGEYCHNWVMIVMVILSNQFPKAEFPKVIEFVYNATESCTRVDGNTEVAFTHMNDTRDDLIWLSKKSDFELYFAKKNFSFEAQIQPRIPKAEFLESEIIRVAKQIMYRSQIDGFSRYIFIISDFELYIPANMSSPLRELVELNQIRFETLQFDNYYDEDVSTYQSDENYFEMINTDSHFIEVDTTDSLYTAKMAIKLFPCVTPSANNNVSLGKLTFFQRNWPYVLLIPLLVLLIIIAVAVWWKCRKNSGNKLGFISKVYAIPNDYFVSERNEWLIENSNITVDYSQKLGSGAFSTVYRGKLTGIAPVCKKFGSIVLQNTYKDCEVAVKTLPAFADEGAKSDFMQEINFMKNLVYHPHLVCMLGISNKSMNGPCLVVEYCSNGDLLHYVRINKKAFVEGEAEGCRLQDLMSICWQISDGLYYLNSKDIIHRDIAARNILLDQNLTAKIGDFGLCRYGNHAIYHTRGGRLPLKWMALESLKSYEYSFKSDVWSLGVLFFEVFSLGDAPFPEVQPADLIKHLEAGHRLASPQMCPEAIAHLMERCWVAEPENRIGIKEVRDELSKFLESWGDNYGYFKMKNEYYSNYQNDS